MILKLLLISLFLFPIAILISQSNTKINKIAITNFKVDSVIKKEEANQINKLIEKKIINLNLYSLATTKSVNNAYKEKASEIRGCMATECALKIGKYLNVDKVIDGTITKQNDEYIVKVYIIDVDRKRIEFSDTVVLKSIRESDENFELFAKNLQAHTMGLPWKREKSRLPFIWRSSLFSGWGQWYEGNQKKGFLFMGTGGVLLVNFIYSYNQYESTGKAYESTPTIPYTLNEMPC
ncbi:MAG: hypothetical protein H7A23_06545 [Leptospiraceae bacterium]|nr:hypothetical protein [Leptospiraceae bacterium]